MFSLVNCFESLYEFTISSYKIMVFDEVDLLFRPENFFLLKKIISRITPSHTNMFIVTNSNIFIYTTAFNFQKNIFIYNEKHTKFNFFPEIKHEYIYCSNHFKLKFLLAFLKHKERRMASKKNLGLILIFFKDHQKSENFVKFLKKNQNFCLYFTS